MHKSVLSAVIESVKDETIWMKTSKLMIQYLFSVDGSISLDQIKVLEEFISQISEILRDLGLKAGKA